MLSSNVVKPRNSSGEVFVWVDKGRLYVYAIGDESRGYVWTEVSGDWDKDESPKFTVLQVFMTKAVAMLLDDEDAWLVFDENELCMKICSKSINFSFRAVRKKFDNDKEVSPLAEFSIPSDIMKDVQKKVVPCSKKVMKDPNRPDSVDIVAENGCVTVNATNGTRMATLTMPTTTTAKDFHILTPPALWNLAGAAQSGSIHLKLYENEIAIYGDKFSYKFRNYNGPMVNYKLPLNNSFEVSIQADKEKLLQALRAVQLVACTLDNHFMELHFEGNEMCFFASDKGVGTTVARVPFVSSEASRLNQKSIVCNNEYFLDAVSASEALVELVVVAPELDAFDQKPLKFLTSDHSIMLMAPLRKESSKRVAE